MEGPSSVSDLLLHDLLGLTAARTPEAPALAVDGVVRTFGELDDRVGRLAAVLAGHAARGDRVAMVADNCGAWIEAYYGVPRAGMVLTPVNQRLTPGEQADLLGAAGPTVLLGERARLDELAALADRFPSVRTVAAVDEPGWDAMLNAASPLEPILAQDPDEPAWLLFTSGTTRRPKGVVLTHRSILGAVLNTALARPVAPDDVFLTPFPLCHVAGYNVLVFHLHGCPAVVLPRFTAEGFVAAVAEHGVTVASLAPTMLDSLLDHGGELPSLRLITHGAAPMPESVRRRATVPLSEGYGMTELSGNAVFDGRPGPLVAVRLDPGTGEILVRGDQVTAGYWSDPASTAEAFEGDWFRTGDVGEWRDGRLHVVDRRKDIIITGGENVASREVEDVLHDHPAVDDVAVIGVPDDHWGEAICAVVVRATDANAGADTDADSLIEHVRARLASFKKPRHVVFVDELPRNAAGKVRKDELRRIAARHLGE